MKKFALLSLAAVSAAILSLASVPQSAEASKPCARAKYDTKMLQEACKKGGQKEAQKAMKKFLSQAKKQDSSLTCKSCHTNLSPKYDLTADGLEKFKKLGGK